MLLDLVLILQSLMLFRFITVALRVVKSHCKVVPFNSKTKVYAPFNRTLYRGQRVHATIRERGGNELPALGKTLEPRCSTTQNFEPVCCV